jgi:hypothetical protein
MIASTFFIDSHPSPEPCRPGPCASGRSRRSFSACAARDALTPRSASRQLILSLNPR